MNKKVLVLVIVLLITNISVTYADSKHKSVELNELKYLENYEENNYSVYSNAVKTFRGNDYWIVVDKKYLGLEEQRFVKYLTSSWSKSEGYTYSDTVRYHWSLSGSYESSMFSALGLNFTASRSISHSVGSYIPANEKRNSKLGFAADYNRYRVKMEYKDFWSNKTLRTKSGVIVEEPTDETYLLVIYK